MQLAFMALSVLVEMSLEEQAFYNLGKCITFHLVDIFVWG